MENTRGKSGINIAELKGCPLRATAITYDPHGWVNDLTCDSFRNRKCSLHDSVSGTCACFDDMS